MSSNTFQQDVATVRAFVERKVAVTSARNKARWQQAVADAEAIITMIQTDYQPAAIYQWGSVLDCEQFTGISDIDIAIEGLESAEQFFELIGKAEKMTRLPLDIVEMEHIEPEYANLIKAHGRCVWKRENHE